MPTRSGFRPGRYDSRDHIYSIRTSPASIAKADQVIIRHDIPVIDQGTIVPCCVSVAVTTCLEVLDKDAQSALSFMYNYYRARQNPGSLGVLEIRQGLAAAASYGICIKTLHDVSLDRAGAITRPIPKADEEAKTRMIAFDSVVLTWAYERFENNNRIDGWRNAIRHGAPVIMGFDLTSAYKNIPHTENTHTRPENDVGTDGHAVTVMGYDNDHDNGSLGRGAFFIRDSRGDGFADKGYWWLPYDLVETHLIVDSWTVLSLTETIK